MMMVRTKPAYKLKPLTCVCAKTCHGLIDGNRMLGHMLMRKPLDSKRIRGRAWVGTLSIIAFTYLSRLWVKA